MGKLRFNFGTMNSGKTALLLMEAYSYESQGKKVLAMKPVLDTRSETIKSRVNIEGRQCVPIPLDMDLYEFMLYDNRWVDVDYIIIDEGQFLTQPQVKQLNEVSERLDINVIVYGLKNTFISGKLFEGSKALLFYADELSEIETSCQYCDRPAKQNLLMINDEPVYAGEVVQIGDVKGEKRYVQVCNKHYMEGKDKQ